MAFFQTGSLWVNQLSDGVAALILDVPERSVNALSRQVLADLDAALDRVAAEKSFRLLVIRSGKPATFIVGADIHELAGLKTPEEAVAFSELGQRLFNKLWRLPIPTAAVIGGACLGGGLELAMACDYRIVLDHPRTLLGMPEVELGLIPAWGGTVWLPALVGTERALRMILGGQRLSAKEAVAWGLADEISSEKEEEPPACLAAPVKRRWGPPARLSFRQRILENRLGRWLIFRGAARRIRRRAPDDMPAPFEALEAVRAGLRGGMDAGLACEREAVARLSQSDACRNLIGLFLGREAARKPYEKKQRGGPEPIRRVGVVGAGAMGASIVQLAILKGCDVVVREPTEPALGAAILRLLGLFNQAVQAGLLAPSDVQKTLANIHGTTAWKGFADLDLVIECVAEDAKVKRSVFREMEKHTSRSTALVTNTSSLAVAPLGEDLQYPDRVAGLHFFNPVLKVPLVEIVPTAATKQEVLDELAGWVVGLGKVPVFVKDSPGFLVNRILAPYLNEAVTLVAEGMRVQLVDDAMRRFGMLAGPLQVLDQVGLDVAAAVASSLSAALPNAPSPSRGFEVMRSQKWLGSKTEVGFYRYRRGRASPNPDAERLLREQAATGHVIENASPDDLMAEARERLVGLMVNEAARCLAEGLVKDAATLDLAMALGSGWAPHRGGPLRYGAWRGYGDVVESLEGLARRLGPRFEPAAELRRLAAGDTPSA
jgi:3-hydroxyacyl-CoA dehydrogenase/enoyl-CoA hydratase/3-hydroxybutyryl-CoA epimerase